LSTFLKNHKLLKWQIQGCMLKIISVYHSKTFNKFVFSKRLPDRLKRHLAFWFTIILFHTCQTCFEHYLFDLGFFENVRITLKYVPSKILLTDIIFCYPVIYVLVPKYFLKKRYILFLVGFISICLIVFSISTFYRYQHFQVRPSAFFRFIWGSIIDFIFVGPLAVSAIFIGLKMLKAFYLKEEEKQTLIIENASAELRLLKAQVHPHFLFNTLNNIYSFTLSKDPRAAALLDKLTSMLDYIRVEGEYSLVPFEKELKLLNDYVCLEKVRYGSRLDLQIKIEGNYENKLIAPLLMLPFVENCFKHGASIMRGKQWINVNIHVRGNELNLLLSNSKPPQSNINNREKGIGLRNVRKRLELLYPKKHFLKIDSTVNSYSVHLMVLLQFALTQDTSWNKILKQQSVRHVQ
jgi:sensor histidine kinase YesM